MATINGTAAGDVLRGTNAADTINGLGGNDILVGLGGNDTLVGGTGADVFVGGAGADTFVGRGSDGDTVDYSRDGGSRGVTVNLSGSETHFGLAPDTARDTFGTLDSVANVPNVIGTRLADRIHGGGHDNRLDGGAGNDTIVGGRGDDVIIGGLGKDTLHGGEDADIFDYNSTTESTRGANADVIEDFRTRVDDIDLRDIDADIDGTAGNQAFRWIGSSAFSGVDGQLRFANGILQGDTNGDRIADFEIKITGTVASGDVIL